MKSIATIVVLAALVSCSRLVVMTDKTIGVSTRSYRTTTQISVDYETDRLIEKLVKREHRFFLGIDSIIPSEGYDINTFNNTVLVTGIVDSEQNADFIVKKAKEVLSVVDVINELEISPGKYRQIARDIVIKNSIISKIKVKFLIKTVNYKISVVNGRVFIIGIAENGTELETLTKSISTVRGVREVVSYVILMEDMK
jgi:osmotically-inducible protein OsmY